MPILSAADTVTFREVVDDKVKANYCGQPLDAVGPKLNPELWKHLGDIMSSSGRLTAEYKNDLMSMDDILYQKTNLLFNIHCSDYTAFDLYYLWRVGVNIFNVDRTVHNEEFFKEICAKISEARTYNLLGPYRPIGVAVTMSATTPIEIDDNVDIIIVKDILNKDDLLKFRRNHSTLNKLILVWISSYGLDDVNFIIKLSDGVVLDFYDDKRIVQKHCIHLFKKCREMYKPIITSRPDFIDLCLNQFRDLLPIAKKLVDFNLDGVLLEDKKCQTNIVYGVYNFLSAMIYIDGTRVREDHLRAYYKIRAELKIPVLPPLSVAHAASLAALNSEAAMIIVLSRSGRSARWISCASPPCYVLAITTQPSTARKLHVYKQLLPLVYDQPNASTWQQEFWNRIKFGTEFALKIGLLTNGAKFVVLSQHGDDGYCNKFQILTAPKLKVKTQCY